jgi:hypothetical protein
MIVNPRFRLPIDTRTTPHLGLAYLAAVSEQRGDEVLLFDADVEDEPITEVVKRFDPEIIGITANTPQVKSYAPGKVGLANGCGTERCKRYSDCAGRSSRVRTSN